MIPIPRFSLFALGLGGVLIAGAPSLFAQAGLSGNALSGQWEEMRGNAGTVDKGLQSQSALGQLEELTGTKVDRSQSSTRPGQPRVPAKPKLSAQQNLNNMVRQQIAATVVEAVLTNLLFGDPSAEARAQQQQAEAEAAAREAAAEAAEQARLAQEEFAANLRAAWDAQDTAMTDTLSDAFTVRAGTAFFGESNNPDADALAKFDQAMGSPDSAGPASAVELPDKEHLAVDPAQLAMPESAGAGLTTGAGIVAPAATNRWARPDDAAPSGRSLTLTPRTAAEEAALLGAKWYVDTMKDAATDSLWNFAAGKLLHLPENLPGQKAAAALLDWKEKYENLSNPLKAKARELQELIAGGSLRAAQILGSQRTSDGGFVDSYNTAVEEEGGEIGRDVRGLAFDSAAGATVKSPEFGPAEEVPLEDSSVIPLFGVSKGRYGHIKISR